MTASAAISGYSTTLQVDDGSTAFAAIAEVTKIAGFGIERSTLEATHLTSPDEWKEFIYGMLMVKAFSIECNYLPTETMQKDSIAQALPSGASSIARDWRLVLPNFGAVTKTATVVGSTWTSTAHGYLTGQSIRLTTSGTIPTGFVVGRTYWLRRLSADTFSLHLTPWTAYSGSGAVSASDGGTGTHTANGTSLWAFTAECSGFSADAEPDAKLTGTIQYAVTGASTLTP